MMSRGSVPLFLVMTSVSIRFTSRSGHGADEGGGMTVRCGAMRAVRVVVTYAELTQSYQDHVFW